LGEIEDVERKEKEIQRSERYYKKVQRELTTIEGRIKGIGMPTYMPAYLKKG